MPAGRPSSFTQAVADEICARMIRGESLRAVCRDPEMPNKPCVLKWLSQNEEFAAQYAHARALMLDELAERLEEDIADEPDVPRARLLFDQRRWYLSKLAPKKYGDRIETVHSGTVNHKSELSDAELEAHIAGSRDRASGQT